MSSAKRFPALLLWLALSAAGCHWPQSQPPTTGVIVATDPHRNTDLARKLNSEACKLLASGDLAGAEKQLQASLAADPFFGPAKNNLGTVYYRQKRYDEAGKAYAAAAEFMPDRAEPRYNLGLVFEKKVEHFPDAVAAYEEAHRLSPGSLSITGNLARMYVRTRRDAGVLRPLLVEIVQKDTRSEWVAWARGQLAALMGRTSQPATEPESIAPEERGKPGPMPATSPS